MNCDLMGACLAGRQAIHINEGSSRRMNLLQKILKTIQYYNMLEKGNRVLVAVSGGPDSVCLLHILNRLKAVLGLKLYIAHLDHGIRGMDSQKDALFVKKLAETLGLPFSSKKLPGQSKRSKLSLEEELRKKRYSFFKTEATKIKASVIATAHTLDDQAETVMMRIIKGASLKGAIGILPVRREGRLKFIRPIIEIEKKEVLSYLKKRGLPFRVDKTNLEDKFLRNRVRNKILPYLAKINPRVKRALCNLAESLREDFEYIEREKKRNMHLMKKNKKMYEIRLCDIMLQPKAIRKEIVREALMLAGANIKKLTYRHWKDIDLFLRTKSSGKSIDLPGGVKIKRQSERLIFA